MTIKSIPTTVSTPSITPEPETTSPAKLKPQDAKASVTAKDAQQTQLNSTPAKDAFGPTARAPLPEGAQSLTATPPGTATVPTELREVFQQIVAPLAAMIGAPSAGAPAAAPAFTAQVSFDTLGSAGGVTLFTPESRAALLELHTLVQSGALRLPVSETAALDRRVASAVSFPSSEAVTRLLSQYSPQMQAAIRQVGATIAPTLARFLSGPREDRDGVVVARTPSITVDLRGANTWRDVPPDLRRALEAATPGLVDRIHGRGVPGRETEPLLDDEPVVSSTLGEPLMAPITTPDAPLSAPPASIDARVAAGEVVIPAPAMHALESAYSSLASMMLMNPNADIETLCMLVMQEGARGASLDLRDQLKEMQKINQQKKTTRAYISTMKKKQAEMKAELRTEYDRRSSLPEGNSERIAGGAPTFDDFCISQKLQVTDGRMDASDDGMPPSPAPGFAVSPNKTFYAQPTTSDQTWNGYTISAEDRRIATDLGVDAQQVMQLRRTWDSDPQLQVRMNGDFNEWIVRSSSEGGVGLTIPAGADQKTKVASYLAEHDPSLVTSQAAGTYHLSDAQMSKLYDTWANDVNADQKAAAGGTFASWVASAAGPHLSAAASSDDNLTTMNRYLASVEKDEAVASISTAFLISPSDTRALQDLFDALPDSAKNGTDFAGWLRQPAPIGPGLTSGSVHNTDKLERFWTKVLGTLSRVGGAAGSSTSSADDAGAVPTLHATSRGVRVEVSPAAAIDQARAAGDPLSNQHAQAVSFIEQALAGVPEEYRDEVRQTLFDGLSAILARGNGYHGGLYGTMNETLERMQAKFPASVMGAIRQYVGLGYALAGAELKYAATQNTPSLNSATILRGNGFAGAVLYDGDSGFSDFSNDANWVANCTTSFTPAVYGSVGQQIDSEVEVLGYPTAPGAPGGAAPADPFAGLGSSDVAAARDVVIDRLIGSTYSVNYPPVPSDLNPEPLSAAEQTRLTELETMRDAADHTLFGEARREFVAVTDEYWHLKFRDMRDKGEVLPGVSSTPPLSDLSAAQRSAMATLGTTPDGAITQPGQVQGIEEMSLAQMDAYIGDWEAKKDTLGDMSEERSLKLQMAQDRYTKFMSTLSNMMKKMSDTGAGIVANLK